MKIFNHLEFGQKYSRNDYPFILYRGVKVILAALVQGQDESFFELVKLQSNSNEDKKIFIQFLKKWVKYQNKTLKDLAG